MPPTTISSSVPITLETAEQKKHREDREQILALALLMLMVGMHKNLWFLCSEFLSGGLSVPEAREQILKAIQDFHTKAAFTGRKLAGVYGPVNSIDEDYGKAAVRADSPHVDDLVDDMENGRYYPKDNPPSPSSGVITGASSTSERRDLSQRLRRTVDAGSGSGAVPPGLVDGPQKPNQGGASSGFPEPPDTEPLPNISGPIDRYLTGFPELTMPEGMPADWVPIPPGLINRLLLYARRLRGTAEQAWAEAMPLGTQFLWELGTNTTDHCAPCQEYADWSHGIMPYTLATLPTFPGRGDTPCLANCDCNLRTLDGRYCFPFLKNYHKSSQESAGFGITRFSLEPESEKTLIAAKGGTTAFMSESLGMNEFVTRVGKVFQVGSYPDKQFELSDSEARAACVEFSPVPANLEHQTTPIDGILGGLQRLWKQGSELFAECRVPKWMDDHLRSTGTPLKPSLEWDRGTKKVAGVAWVNFPRIQDAALMSAFSGTVKDESKLFWDDRTACFMTTTSTFAKKFKSKEPQRWTAGDPPTGFPGEEPEPGDSHVAKIDGQTKSITQADPVDGKTHMTTAQALLVALQNDPDNEELQKLVMEYSKKSSTGSKRFMVNHGDQTTSHNSYEDAVNAATNGPDDPDGDGDDDSGNGNDDDNDSGSGDSSQKSSRFVAQPGDFTITPPKGKGSAKMTILNEETYLAILAGGFDPNDPAKFYDNSASFMKDALGHGSNARTDGMTHGVYLKGGSIGGKSFPHVHPQHGTLMKTYDNEEAAKEHATRGNKNLSPGEKKYYRMKYHVKPLTGDAPDGSDKVHMSTDGTDNQARTGRKAPIMSRFTDKVKALFGLAGVPDEATNHLTDEDLQQAFSSSDINFSDSAEFAELATENESLRTQLSTQAEKLKSLETQSANFSAHLEEQKALALFSTNSSEIDRLARLPGARITPAEADAYRKLAQANPAAFSEVLPILKEKPPLAQFSTLGIDRMKTNGSDPAASLDEKTKERMAKTKEAYHVAFSNVCRDNPDLVSSHQAQFEGGN